MSLELEELRLGESDETLLTTTSDEVREACLAMAQQARRSINIFTYCLDGKIYNSLEFYDAVLQLATSSRHADVRIIIRDPTPVVKRGSRLVNLSHRLSSRVQIRRPPIEYRDALEEFVLVDERGLMHRPLADRYEGEACFNAALKGRQLQKYFNDCWEKSAADPELRRLHL